MTRPIVIGIGNSLRQDDGVGARAADLLAERLQSDEAEIVSCHQLMPELAAKLAATPMAIFLDASVDQPFRSLTLARVEPRSNTSGLSHHVTPAGLLFLAKVLNGHTPVAFVVTAGLKDFEPGQRLTTSGEACAGRMADLAFEMIKG